MSNRQVIASNEDSTTCSCHATGALLSTQCFADISKRTLIEDFMLCSFIGQPQIALICHQSRPLTIDSEKCFHRDTDESLFLILTLLG